MKLPSFRIPIYGSKVFVAYGVDGREIAGLLPRSCRYEYDRHNAADVTSFDNGKFLIAFHTKVTPNTFAHEVRHLTDYIMEWHEVDDEEAAAYLNGWVAERLTHLLGLHIRRNPTPPST